MNVRSLALLLALSPVTLAQAPAPTITADPKAVTVTVTMTGSPMTGVCPFNMNLSWTATNASVCTKTGAWSGNATASGSESVQVNATASTYTLTCSSSTDSRTVSWANPTQNTDGTAVVLSGNKVYHAANATNIETANPAIVLVPAKTTYVLSGLPAGPRSIGIKATGPSPNLLDSAMSSLANVTIVLPTGVATVQAGCTSPPVPKPPTALTIASTVWEAIHNYRGERVGRDVGTVPLNTQCLGTEPYILQGEVQYWGIPKALITLYRKPKSELFVGRCELPQST